MDMSLFEYEQIRGMRPGEFRVYNFIVSHMDRIPEMKIRQISEACGVSTTTVLRFCEKAGCEGFTELKYRIRRELSEDKRPAGFDSDPALQFIKNAEYDPEFSEKTVLAAEMCSRAAQIILCGDGGSSTLTRYGAYLFNSMGKSAFPAEQAYGTVCPGTDIKSMLLVLSVEGEKVETVSMINRYKSSGAFVISITNTEHCPAAEMSDINFSCYMPDMDSGAGCERKISQIPAVYILEVLAAGVQRRLR